MRFQLIDDVGRLLQGRISRNSRDFSDLGANNG